jgi:hypothetical protein
MHPRPWSYQDPWFIVPWWITIWGHRFTYALHMLWCCHECISVPVSLLHLVLCPVCCAQSQLPLIVIFHRLWHHATPLHNESASTHCGPTAWGFKCIHRNSSAIPVSHLIIFFYSWYLLLTDDYLFRPIALTFSQWGQVAGQGSRGGAEDGGICMAED